MSKVVVAGVTDQSASGSTPGVLVDSSGRVIIAPGAAIQGQLAGTPVAITSPGVQLTNRSGTITAGGTAQVLMPAKASRQGFSFQNVSSGDLWIDDTGGTAVASQPSIRVAAGSLYENPPNGCPVGQISIFGATTAQAFSCREW